MFELTGKSCDCRCSALDWRHPHRVLVWMVPSFSVFPYLVFLWSILGDGAFGWNDACRQGLYPNRILLYRSLSNIMGRSVVVFACFPWDVSTLFLLYDSRNCDRSFYECK